MKALIFILATLPLITAAQIKTANNTATIGGTTGFTMADSQWNDLVVPGTASKINPTVARPVFNFDSVAVELIRDADSSDILYYQYQLPHSIDYGTITVSPHFHYMQYLVSDTTFEVVIMYRIRELGAKSGNWVRLIPTKRSQLTFTSAPFHQICEFPSIALTDITESSYLDIKFYRKDGAGNPATVWLLGFDIHYPIISFGSPNEYPAH